MKQIQNHLSLLLLLLFVVATATMAKPKRIKIMVSPADTQVFVDGNYVREGVVEVSFDRSDFMAGVNLTF